MVEIAVISDTHVPSRASEIPDWVAERVRDADHTIHAGDFDSPEAYEAVADLTDGGEGSDPSRTSSDHESDGNLTAVLGNTDPLSLDLPEVAVTEISGTTFVVTHGHRTGAGESYREGIAGVVSDEVDGPAIAVAGHSHEVIDEDVEGIRLLNPGSATGTNPAESATMMTVEIVEGDVEVEVYEEDERVEV